MGSERQSRRRFPKRDARRPWQHGSHPILQTGTLVKSDAETLRRRKAAVRCRQSGGLNSRFRRRSLAVWTAGGAERRGSEGRG